MARTDDTPQSLDTRLTLDETSNFFIKDSKIPKSYVVVEKFAQNKGVYEPALNGTAHPKKTDYFLYEEGVKDIGNGIFEIEAKYAAVPPVWYSFETLNIPYLKFKGLSVIGGGSITINTSYLFNYLNVQSIGDVNFFNEDAYTSFEEKSGTINVACRVKHEYVNVPDEQVLSGDILQMNFDISSDLNSYGDGAFNCGYFLRDADPQVNVSIDQESTFQFETSTPSPKVRIASGVYAGNIYYKHTYEIIAPVTI